MCVECITSSKDSEKLEKSLCVRDKLETYIRQEWDQIATPKLQKLITSMPFELFWKEEEMLHHCKRASVPNMLRPVAGIKCCIQFKRVLHYLCSIVNIGSFDVKIFYANLKMSQHSRNSCCIYLSVCLINIISRSELVRISSLSVWVSEVNGRIALGGGGFLNPQILEVGGTKKKTSFICLSRGRISAVSHRASARQTRTFAAVYLGVTRKPPHSARVYEW